MIQDHTGNHDKDYNGNHDPRHLETRNDIVFNPSEAGGLNIKIEDFTAVKISVEPSQIH